MSEDGCLGLCDIDWESGVCNGCGRRTAEIYGEEEQPPPADAPSADATPAGAG